MPKSEQFWSLQQYESPLIMMSFPWRVQIVLAPPKQLLSLQVSLYQAGMP